MKWLKTIYECGLFQAIVKDIENPENDTYITRYNKAHARQIAASRLNRVEIRKINYMKVEWPVESQILLLDVAACSYGILDKDVLIKKLIKAGVDVFILCEIMNFVDIHRELV